MPSPRAVWRTAELDEPVADLEERDDLVVDGVGSLIVIGLED